MEKQSFWEDPIDQIYAQLKSQKDGLSSSEAKARLKEFGPNSLKPPKRGKGLILFLSQFKSPLILLLICAAILSFFLGGHTDSTIIFTIVFLSGLLSFFQERGALNSLEKLLELVENKATVLRDGKEKEIPLEEVIPGDIVLLRAGDLIPADCVLIESKYLFVDEAMMTGESIPVEKSVFADSQDASALKKNRSLLFGTNVASGIGTAIVVTTGRMTEYSLIHDRISFHPPETAFEIGVRRFGFFLMEVTLVITIAIFAFNTYFHKPILQSFLFALALAVGLTPQLLPAIISVNLSHGARAMAKKKVIIKRLASIENFGQMNVLCSDKTGTLTIGKAKLEKATGTNGNESKKASLYALLNARFQTGYANPLDHAICQKENLDTSGWEKIDEIPYDFFRKCLSVIFKKEGKTTLIVKGAFPQVLSICSQAELEDSTRVPIASLTSKINEYYEKKCKEGYRILGLAYGDTEKEENLIFLGFLLFLDPIKPDLVMTVEALKKKGVHLKIITGDHCFVAAHAASSLGVSHTSIITGKELYHISDHALMKTVREKMVFAEIEPNQKERIILALRKSGSVVGYLGDGINDVSALHSADVSIAVDSGADAAKEAADIVLLEKDLSVLNIGIEEGRRTFINTLRLLSKTSTPL